MAIDLTTALTNFTPADADYPQGSAKNESAVGVKDGSEYKRIRANDILGFQQALLRTAGIVPTGNADTARASQYWQAGLHMATAGTVLKEAAGSAADVYVLEPVGNNLIPALYSENLEISFVVVNATTGTGTVTVEVNDGVNPTLGVRDVKKNNGLDDLLLGDWRVGDIVTLSFRPGLPHFEWTRTSKSALSVPNFQVFSTVQQSIPDNVVTKVEFESKEPLTDPQGWFDNVTNFRYTPLPLRPGLYNTGVCVGYDLATGIDKSEAQIEKNTITIGVNREFQALTGSRRLVEFISTSVVLNGTGDFIEFFTLQDSSPNASKNTSGLARELFAYAYLVTWL